MALSKGKKIVVAIITAAVAVGAALGIAYSAGAFNNTNLSVTHGGTAVNPTPSNPGTTIVTPTNPGSEVTPSNPTNPGSEVTPTTPTNPEVNPGSDTPQTPEVTLTEAEYKALFLEELTSNIQEYYNNKVVSPKSKIYNLSIKDINYNDGTVYFNCDRNNNNMFYIVNNDSIVNFDTFEELSKNTPTEFTTATVQTVQEQSLANEIAEFALEQDAVKNFLAQNGISANTDYTVLNATEFASKSGGYLSTSLVIKILDKIVEFDLSGRTGICNSQQEYLNKFKDGYLEKVENLSLQNYSELDSASASESYTFTSSYGGLKGTMVYNNHGAGCPQFEEMSM